VQLPRWREGNEVCCHRAAFWYLTGVLDFNDPEPPAGAATPCDRCHGTGALTLAVAGGCAAYPTHTFCRACHGAGQVPLAA
jgi:hypothetical protein